MSRPILIPGDLDGDGDVDSVDANRLVQNWTGALMPGEGNKTREQGDIDGDGDVDTNDRTALAQNWTGAIDLAFAANSSSRFTGDDLSPWNDVEYDNDLLEDFLGLQEDHVLVRPIEGFFLQ